MSLQPRDPQSLDHSRLFDKGCVESRLDELTKAFVDQFTKEEMEKIVDQARRAFKPIPDCEWLDTIKFDKFGEQARKEAEKTLEQERQNYVNYMTPYITNNLNQIIKRLRNLVIMVDDKGKPFKVKIFVERRVEPDNTGKFREHDIEYVLDYDYERVNQIQQWRFRLIEFRDYVPYFSETLKDLWNTASELATLETVRVDAKKR